jgi:hypothetical protein
MAATDGYLELADVVLAPPLPALLSTLMTCGVAFLGWLLAQRLRRGRPTPLDVAGGFVVAATGVAVLVHALALAQLSTRTVLRPLGWALAAAGAWAIAKHGRRVLVTAATFASARVGSRGERLGALIGGVTTVGLALAALGPVTDIDSLHYHLCVPLDWLRHGGAYARPDWFHSRLVGLAESLNLLGLGAGTDSFGAALQFGGYIAASIAVAALAKTRANQIVGWLVVASCPVVAFLVPNQKPQMLPSAGTVIALVLTVQRFDDFSLEDAFVAFVCAAFALSSKISFLLSAGFLVLLGLAAARRSGRLVPAVGVAVAALVVVWLPLLGRSYAFFGDPISPFLERFKPEPDPVVVGFSRYLRDMAGERTLVNLLLLPVAILGTVHATAITSVLGLGSLAFIPALATRGRHRMLLWAALAATLACLLLGQLTARFYLDPYLWAGAALAAASEGRLKRLVVGGIYVQGALAALIALYGAASLFPGALTAGRREAVLTRLAAGYPESKWLDRVLPADAVIVAAGGRYHLFSPRPFVVADPVDIHATPSDGEKQLTSLVRDHHLTHLVYDGGDLGTTFERFTHRCRRSLTPPTLFPIAGRNPLNHSQYASQIFAFGDCDLRDPAAHERATSDR